MKACMRVLERCWVGLMSEVKGGGGGEEEVSPLHSGRKTGREVIR